MLNQLVLINWLNRQAARKKMKVLMNVEKLNEKIELIND